MAKGPPPTPVPGWGEGPLMPHSFAETYYMKVSGQGNRIQMYHEDYDTGAKKPKKERKGFFLFQRDTGEGWANRLLGRANRRAIEEDNWRRDQGGGQIIRGGYGIATDWAPGPPAGFQEVPQVSYGPHPGHWENGMWYDD